MRARSLPAWLRRTAFILIGIMGLHAMAPTTLASPIASAPVVSTGTRTTDMATIQKVLEQKVVQQRLTELGFTQTEIQQRLARASDAHLHQFVSQYDTVMAGGDGGIGIVSLLLIVLLVILILKIAYNEPIGKREILKA